MAWFVGIDEARRARRVLLVGDDPDDAETLKRVMRAFAWESCHTRHGFHGLAMVQGAPFDVVLVDLSLTDMPGIDVVRGLLAQEQHSCLIVIGSTPAISEMSGAAEKTVSGILKKGFNASDLIVTINSALRQQEAARVCAADARRVIDPLNDRASSGRPISRSTPGSVTERWAQFVLRTIDARADPKTVITWAKSLGVSQSALCECCRLVHVKAHDARDFARLLRAICQSGEDWQPEAVLDLADERTLNKLLARAGFPNRIAQTPSVPEFLERQQLIPQDHPGLQIIQSLLFYAPTTSRNGKADVAS